jgi:hypothetical protein
VVFTSEMAKQANCIDYLYCDDRDSFGWLVGWLNVKLVNPSGLFIYTLAKRAVRPDKRSLSLV